MSQIYMARKPQVVKIGAICAGVLALLVGGWWVLSTQMGAGESGAAPAVGSTGVQAPQLQPTPQTVAGAVVLQNLVKEQSSAAQELAKHDDLAPLAGPILERPSFVSPVEWAVLKGVSGQKPDAQKELTRMVNFLRFNKRLELWKSAQVQQQPQRSASLAAQLLDELPTRVSNGEMGASEAQSLGHDLLAQAQANADANRRGAMERSLDKDLQARSDAFNAKLTDELRAKAAATGEPVAGLPVTPVGSPPGMATGGTGSTGTP